MSRLLSSDKECVADFILLIISLQAANEEYIRSVKEWEDKFKRTIQEYQQ